MKLQLILILCISLSFTNVFANEVGQIKFSENFYTLEDTPKIILIDSDMNTNPTIRETIEIDVWSDLDAGGIDLFLNETGNNTGIFEATIMLSDVKESHGVILKVNNGDYITAEYRDFTLPDPYSPRDRLDIQTYVIISDEPKITIQTDKSSYHQYETILITGDFEPLLESHNLNLTIRAPNGQNIQPKNFIIYEDKKFSAELITGGVLIENNGIYTVKVQYANNKAITTFELLPLPVQIFTDKSSYNQIETIQITGEINEIEISPLDNIAITLHDIDDNILIPELLIPITNNAFSHDIITDDIIWNDYYGDVKITAQLQNYTTQTTIHYSYYPAEISLEYLHDLISDNSIMVNEAYSDIYIIKEQNIQYSILFETLQETIVQLQLQIDELRGAPIIISDAPIITSLVIDDPDNLDDIYSKDDIIIITFDSNTNMPNGMGVISKVMVDNMFDFSDSIGNVYRGIWETPNTFVIIIKGIKNTEIEIGSTTVTPNGFFPILSMDGTSTPSNATSPVLSGDFGIIEDPSVSEQLEIMSSDHEELNEKIKELNKKIKRLQKR